MSWQQVSHNGMHTKLYLTPRGVEGSEDTGFVIQYDVEGNEVPSNLIKLVLLANSWAIYSTVGVL